MKKLIILSSMFLATAFAIAQKKQAKSEYVFPDAMAQPVRTEYAKLCEKGRALYELSCARCHNTLVKGKIVIPDFTEEQLGAYSIRVANPKHEDHVSEASVSAEELALISTFLTYKKKNEPLLLINNGLAHQ
jgi:cytochrome c5